MPLPQAIYTVVVRAQASAAADEEAVIHYAFVSDLQPSELAPRLAKVIDEHLTSPRTTSNWWFDLHTRRTSRMGGFS